MQSLARPPIRASRSESFPYPEKVFLYDAVPVAYFDSGRPPAWNGETLLFIHGLGANLTHFEYVAPPLAAAGYRVCGLDLPGFGLSGKPHREYTIPYFSNAVFRLLDQLGIERATLVGHSLGGLVAADGALRDPRRVERLVLISSAGLFRMPLPIRLAARTILSSALVAPALERNARRLLNWVLAEKNERTERFIEQSVTRPDPRFCLDLARVMSAASRDLTSVHLLTDGNRLTMPTLVIWGERDRLLPFKPVPAWTKRLPDGELEVIERCGHMPIIESPERVVSRMLQFLRRRALSVLAVSQAS